MMDISDRALELVMDWLLETSQPFFRKDVLGFDCDASGEILFYLLITRLHI